MDNERKRRIHVLVVTVGLGVLSYPASVLALEDNDAYTTSHDKLWKVDLGTGAETLIGTVSGGNFLSGLTFDPPTGRLYAIDDVNIIYINPTNAVSTTVGPHGLAPLFSSAGLAADRLGNLYLVTAGTTYSVNKSTGLATVLGPNSLSQANALAVSPDGILYAVGEVASLGGISGLVRLNLTTGALLSVIGPLNDPSQPGNLSGGMGMDFDSRGVLYLGNASRNKLYVVSLDDATLTPVGDLPVTYGSLAVFRDCNDNGIIDDHDIVSGSSTDANGNGIPDECVFCGDGTCNGGETFCTCADCGTPAANEQVGSTCTDTIDNDCDLAVDCDDSDCNFEPTCAPPVPGGPGDLVLTTRNNDRVQRYDSVTGQFLYNFSLFATLIGPSGLTIGPDGLLYVAGLQSRNVVRFDLVNGLMLGVFVQPEAGGLFSPAGITFGPDGNLYIADFFRDRVLRYDGQTGAFMDTFVAQNSGGLDDAWDLRFGPDGNLYVTSEQTSSVLRYDGQTGAFLDAFVPSMSGGLIHPRGLAFGPDGNLYVSNWDSQSAVQRYNGMTGALIDVFVPPGSGGLGHSFGLAFGGDGHLYVTSDQTNVVLRFHGETGVFLGGFLNPSPGGSAQYLLFQPPQCAVDDDCNDSNPATTDLCYGGECKNLAFTRLYVDADATGANSGLSWANSFTDLQDALDQGLLGNPLEIWVAEGSYRPDRGTGSRTASFQLHDGISLYGGFAGTEVQLADRNPAVHPTILSGDLAGDDGPNFTNNAENSYHVVKGSNSGIGAPTLMDSFTVTGGNANAPSFKSPDDRGGGMLVRYGSPKVVDCIFLGNTGSVGGGMAGESAAKPDLVNCTFAGNLAVTGGGAVYLNDDANLTLTNCVFTGNAAVQGGAVFILDCLPTLTNCTVGQNTATGQGGGLYQAGGVTTIGNSVIWGNFDEGGSDESAQLDGAANWTITDSCIQGWTGALGGTGNTGDCDPEYIDANGADNIAGTRDDDLRLGASSTCIDAGNNQADTDANLVGVQPLPPIDRAGIPRIINSVVDRGAFERAPGCGSCRLYGDLMPSECLVDVDDLLCVLDGFANPATCPAADLFPCPPTPGAPYGNGLIDVDDILVELDAFTGLYACDPPCPPGACVGDLPGGPAGTECRDATYFPGGMSQTNCFILGGSYCGDGVGCGSPGCP